MIKAFWWRRGPGRRNFGDELTPFLCERLSGRRVEHAPPHLADIIAVGSVLEPFFWKPSSWLQYRGVIWGSARLYGQVPMDLPLAQIVALRGYLTLRRIGCRSKETVLLGDPGLLCSMFVQRQAKRYKLGVIAHWSELNDPLLSHFVGKSSAVALVNVYDPVQEVLNRIAECERILSSSLHGLVVADALEVPNEWLRLNLVGANRLGKPAFKYRDYYSVYGMADKRYLTLGPADTLDSVLARFGPYSRPGLTAVQGNLLASFPFR